MPWIEASNKFRLTQDQTAAVHGLQIGIRDPKIERVRERERLPQSQYTRARENDRQQRTETKRGHIGVEDSRTSDRGRR